MARNESDREDLMREATALGRRIEFSAPLEPATIVAGFRNSGGLSIYFGPDPVYHFDESARLRRAFVGGLLYRTQGTTLAMLKRVRTPAATELCRQDLNDDEQSDFREKVADRLRSLQLALDAGEVAIVQQVPEEDPSLLADLTRLLKTLLSTNVSLAPSIPGKR
jgi:hypothetical protein